MTVATTTNKEIATGNGLTTTFPFTFGTLPTGDLVVSLFDLLGVEIPQTEGVDYTVLGEGSEDGGAVVFTVPPAADYTVLIRRIIPITQPTDFKNQGSFYPRTFERSYDRGIMIEQQQQERIDASMALPPQVTGVSTQLPAPEMNTLFGWNELGTGVKNFPLSSIATSIAYGNKQYITYTGNGVDVNFALPMDPGSLGNLDVSIDGVTQVNGTDFNYVGTLLTFADAPANGAVILVRFDQALPIGFADAAATTYTPPSTGLLGTVKSFLDSLWVAGTNSGAALIRFVQAGTGAIAQTIQAKLRRTRHVEDYGAVGDGVTDDTVAIQNGIAHLASLGGGDLLFDATKYKISSKIQVSVNNVTLKGKGISHSHDVGTNTPGTELLWYGAAGGTMVEFSPVVGAGNQRGHGGGLIDIAVNGRTIADFGLVIKSWFRGTFVVYGASCVQFICDMGVVATLGEARDCQFNTVSIFGRQYAGAPNGGTLRWGGDSLANTSFNRFPEISSTYQNGNGLDLGNGDSNDLGLVRLNSGGGTGVGVIFRGSNAGAVECCRGNRIHMLSPGSGGILAEGTTSKTFASNENVIAWFDDSNGSADPVVETGATLRWGNQRAVDVGRAAVKLTVSDSKANAQTQRALMVSETIRIHNASANHVRMVDSANEYAWHITSNAMTLTRIAGGNALTISGTIAVSVPTIRMTAATPTVSAGQVGFGNVTASTVGAAGGASALPATPSGYLQINIAGTMFKLPYYAN